MELDKNTVIVVLGHRNNHFGKLSEIAHARVSRALTLWQANPCYIVCTGGHSAAFNPTEINHAHYTQQALIAQGVPDSAFLSQAASMFTFEDATLSKPIVSQHGITKVIVVSSEFHLNRVKLIFDFIYNGVDVQYYGAESPISTSELLRLAQHEEAVTARELATIERLKLAALNDC